MSYWLAQIVGSFAKGDSPLDIIVGAFAIAGVAAGSWWIVAYVRDRWRWRTPVTVQYFLPQEHYEHKTFPGAAGEETVRDRLTLETSGVYELMVRLTARTDVTIDAAPRLNIHRDASREKPRVLKPVPSRFAE